MGYIVIAIFFISLFLLLPPSASLQFQMQSPHEQASEDLQRNVPAVARKLRFTEKLTVKGMGVQKLLPYQEQKEDASGKQHQKKQATSQKAKGTGNEWTEGGDSSHYFTMDYSNVRKRRPIHNKSLPANQSP